jgi:exodeoxyribonuclease V alpha subunit
MTLEAIDVTLQRKVYHQVSKFGPPGGAKYLIGRTTAGRSIRGNMNNPVEGQQYRLWGSWKPQKGYPDAFEFTSFEALCERSAGGIAAYLAKGNIPKIGPARARALVDAFGADTLDILRQNPDRALEVPGITEEMVASIRQHFDEIKDQIDPVAVAKLIEMFEGYRFPLRVAKLCVKNFGSDAPEVIRENPYLLIDFPRMGWKSVDPFALEALQYPRDGKYRQTAALVEALNKVAEDGHTYVTRSELFNIIEKRVLGEQFNARYLDQAIKDGLVSASDDGNDVIYQIRDLADAEAMVAERLKTLQGTGPSPVAGVLTVETWGASLSPPLGSDQMSAAYSAWTHPVSIITGAPGTGKSYLTSRFIKRMYDMGHRSIRCVAPTGKAAKRMAELLLEVGIDDIPCSTIHKALRPSPPQTDSQEGVSAEDAKFGRGKESWGFGHHIGNPLEDRIIIVEEPSMLDAKLASSLLQAIAPGTRVIFVGDENQLQSVGPGAILRDMIAAGIPTAVLRDIRRSESAGTVVHACHAVIADRTPCPADEIDLEAAKNWVHIELSDPAEIRDKIVELVCTRDTDDIMWDKQVISPQKGKYLFGCDHLNLVLSHALNAENHPGPPLTDEVTGEIIEESSHPRIGDKVVRTKNAVVDELVEIADGGGRADLLWDGRRWKADECPVVNGDMGTVVDVLMDERACYLVRFRFPDRFVRLPINDAEIELAYAMTVHKMQGSGARVVIIPVSNAFYFNNQTGMGLWCRELFYTAMSRTIERLYTVGEIDAIETACRRKTVDKRRTTLALRLGGRLKDTDESASEDDWDGELEFEDEFDVESGKFMEDSA